MVYSGVSVFDGEYYLVLAACVTLRTFESTKHSDVIFNTFRYIDIYLFIRSCALLNELCPHH